MVLQRSQIRDVTSWVPTTMSAKSGTGSDGAIETTTEHVRSRRGLVSQQTCKLPASLWLVLKNSPTCPLLALLPPWLREPSSKSLPPLLLGRVSRLFFRHGFIATHFDVYNERASGNLKWLIKQRIIRHCVESPWSSCLLQHVDTVLVERFRNWFTENELLSCLWLYITCTRQWLNEFTFYFFPFYLACRFSPEDREPYVKTCFRRKNHCQILFL